MDKLSTFAIDRDFWLSIREAMLSMVNALEIKMQINPTTAEIRREFKKRQLTQMDK